MMKNCNAFLFLLKNNVKKEINDIIKLNNFFSTLKDINFPINSFIKKTLFIFDNHNEGNISKDDNLKAKINIERISKDIFNNRDSLNICLINIQYFIFYLKKVMYYENIDFMVQFEYDNYLD